MLVPAEPELAIKAEADMAAMRTDLMQARIEPFRDLAGKKQQALLRRVERIGKGVIARWSDRPALSVMLTLWYFVKDLTDREVLILWEGSEMARAAKHAAADVRARLRGAEAGTPRRRSRRAPSWHNSRPRVSTAETSPSGWRPLSDNRLARLTSTDRMMGSGSRRRRRGEPDAEGIHRSPLSTRPGPGQRKRQPRDRCLGPAPDEADPSSQHPQPPFKRQPQEAAGLPRAMDPKLDHGETSYKAHGRLAGRKALMTGADSGIGRAAAIAFGRKGADVAFGFAEEEMPDAQEVAKLIEAECRKAVLRPGDITDKSFCETGVRQAVADLGASARWSTTPASRPTRRTSATSRTSSSTAR